MKQILNRLFQHQLLTKEEAKQVMHQLANKEINNAQLAAFISVYLMRSISVDEFIGFSQGLLEVCQDVSELSKYNPVDIVGTGGDGKNTFNISTLASFAVAAAGYKVAKHGNYAASSVSGSSTVMESYGIKFTNDISTLDRSIDKANIAFLHAPLFNNAMKEAAPVRRDLGVRTFFNMLGPTINPIRNSRSVLGVFNLKMARMYHYMYQQTNIDFSIVHSLDGYDEISLTDDFKVITNQSEKVMSPESLGLTRCMQEDLFGGDTPQEAAKVFDNVINNVATSAQKNAVIVNAAIAINTIDRTLPIADCIAQAREAIDSGKLKETFALFREINS